MFWSPDHSDASIRLLCEVSLNDFRDERSWPGSDGAVVSGTRVAGRCENPRASSRHRVLNGPSSEGRVGKQAIRDIAPAVPCR